MIHFVTPEWWLLAPLLVDRGRGLEAAAALAAAAR